MRKVNIIDLPFRGREEFGRLFGHPALEVCRTLPQNAKRADIIVLGGSRRTTADLDYLRRHGGEQLLRSHLSQGGSILAICGGYQMLGQWLFDPDMLQGDGQIVEGLGILPHSTFFGRDMLECRTTARLLVGRGAPGLIEGEEHRSGFSWVEKTVGVSPLLAIQKRLPLESNSTVSPWPQPWAFAPGHEEVDGLVTDDMRIWTSYVHLICNNDAFLQSFLSVR